ncbi:hypothetical protein FIBSPDRAFT_872980 [Athelia psychrophila]|uniref:RING-type domain-containing protein n=1 Tax=Athelia psychrophila TaxID=1759441 RepID=A0A165Z127_9AGAM|nr:hypothetical protein FIBSPDRAFT_872980 [Fibularhizoctonia sp. CBS 109695]
MPVTRTRSTTAPPASSPTSRIVDLTLVSPLRAPPPFPLTNRPRPLRNRTTSSRTTRSRPRSPEISDIASNVELGLSEMLEESEVTDGALDPGMLVMQSTLDEVRQHQGMHLADRQDDGQGPSSSDQARSPLITRLRDTVDVPLTSSHDGTEQTVGPAHDREPSYPPIESLPDRPRLAVQMDSTIEELDATSDSRASTPPQTQTQRRSQTPIDLTQDTEPGSSPSTALPVSSTSSPQLLSNSKPSESSSTSVTSGSTPLSLYTCPICFSPPTNATLTPCGHVCCGACLFTAVKSTLQRGAFMGGGMGQGNLPRCPVCRAPIPGWDGTGGGVIGLRPKAVFLL